MYKLATISNVPVNIHWSTPLALLISAVMYNIHSAANLALVYVLVLIHEFAHVFAARLYGQKCEGINIFVLGGQAMITMPRGGMSEFVISAAGPASNALMALIAIPLLGIIPELSLFVLFNVILAGFNLLPIFPLDGGRIWRSITAAMTGSIIRGTQVATYTAYVGAVGLLCLGLFYGFYMCALIAPLVALASYVEYKSLREEIAEKSL